MTASEIYFERDKILKNADFYDRTGEEDDFYNVSRDGFSSHEVQAAATAAVVIYESPAPAHSEVTDAPTPAAVSSMRPTIVIYPTIPPETVIIPIVCSIVVFPVLVATLICFLRHYNRRARAKEKFRAAYHQGAAAIFSLSRIGAVKPPQTTIGGDSSQNENGQTANGVGNGSLANCSNHNSNRFSCMPELELDTVMEREEEYDDIEDEDDFEDDETSVYGVEAKQQRRKSSIIKLKTFNSSKRVRLKADELNNSGVSPPGTVLVHEDQEKKVAVVVKQRPSLKRSIRNKGRRKSSSETSKKRGLEILSSIDEGTCSTSLVLHETEAAS